MNTQNWVFSIAYNVLLIIFPPNVTKPFHQGYVYVCAKFQAWNSSLMFVPALLERRGHNFYNGGKHTHLFPSPITWIKLERNVLKSRFFYKKQKTKNPHLKQNDPPHTSFVLKRVGDSGTLNQKAQDYAGFNPVNSLHVLRTWSPVQGYIVQHEQG